MTFKFQGIRGRYVRSLKNPRSGSRSEDDPSPSGDYFFFLVPAHPGSHRQNPESRKIVVVVVVVVAGH